MYLEETSKKYLVICDGGNVRSHALAYKLKWVYHQQAIAIGRLNSTPETIEMMCEWADKIAIMQPHMAESVPEKYHDKIVVIDVGPDRWGVHVHPELNEMVTQASHWLMEVSKITILPLTEEHIAQLEQDDAEAM